MKRTDGLDAEATVLDLVRSLALQVDRPDRRVEPGRNVEIFVQRYAYGWSLEQIAASAGISTVRVSQVLASMRDRVDPCRLDPSPFVRLMTEATAMTRATHCQATARLRERLGPGVPLAAALETGAQLWNAEPLAVNWKAMRWHSASRSKPRLLVRRSEGRSAGPLVSRM